VRGACCCEVHVAARGCGIRVHPGRAAAAGPGRRCERTRRDRRFRVGGQTPIFHAATQFYDFGFPMVEFFSNTEQVYPSVPRFPAIMSARKSLWSVRRLNTRSFSRGPRTGRLTFSGALNRGVEPGKKDRALAFFRVSRLPLYRKRFQSRFPLEQVQQ